MRPDRIHPRVLEEGADITAESLLIVFEKSLRPREVPDDWKASICIHVQNGQERFEKLQTSVPHFSLWENYGAGPHGNYFLADEGQQDVWEKPAKSLQS